MEREKRTENTWKRDGGGAWVGQGKRRPVLLYFQVCIDLGENLLY